MIRFLARFFGYWLVAAALVAGTVDGAKSIAGSRIVLTPLSETWATLASVGRGDETDVAAADRQALRAVAGSDAPLAAPEPPPRPLPWPAGPAVAMLMAAPTVLVLGILGFALLVAGRRRRRVTFGREFAT